VPSNTVMEYVKSAGATNEEGPTDKLYREGLESYWNQYYSDAIPKFEEVKRLFPQHSEIDRLLQSSQQAKAEGKDRSGFPFWLVAVIVVVLLLLGLFLIIAVVVFFMVRRRKGKQPAAAKGPAPARPPYSPSPTPSPSPANYSPSAKSPSPGPAPAPVAQPASDQGMTVDLSRTVAIVPDGDTSPISYGAIRFVSGTLAGQQFQVKQDGEFVGRDGSVAQIVISDPRISKRHLWIGVREGRVCIVDQGSRNGTFVNDPKSPRVSETSLNPGDIVILGESDVARFEYRN
jgi:FHA domain-containing protein